MIPIHLLSALGFVPGRVILGVEISRLPVVLLPYLLLLNLFCVHLRKSSRHQVSMLLVFVFPVIESAFQVIGSTSQAVKPLNRQVVSSSRLVNPSNRQVVKLMTRQVVKLMTRQVVKLMTRQVILSIRQIVNPSIR